MTAIPGPVTHPPGMYHPFDPINCSSDAGWQQQQMMQHALVAEQQIVNQQRAAMLHAEATRSHLLLLRR